MVGYKEVFKRCGPVHLLKELDWSNPCHIISVIASLVHSVYVLHRDNKKYRQGSEALAPPWWEAFGYEKYKELRDESESKSESESDIFGAIYIHKLTNTSTGTSTSTGTGTSNSSTPLCVVAFRGTITKSLRDLKDNLSILLNDLHKTPRAKKAIEAVRGAVEEFGRENVWIVGHSLGAAIAMLAAREMVKEGMFMENTFLINPPFPSLFTNLPFLREVVSRVKATLALTLEDRVAFGALAPWRPRLFLNSEDWICSGYLMYFKNRGDGMIESMDMQYSLTGLFSNLVLGKKGRESMHLIPSAYVTENCNPVGIFEDDHGINQWWNPNLQWETKEYTCQV